MKQTSKIQKICLTCKKSFEVIPARLNAKYCSQKCSGLNQRGKTKAKRNMDGVKKICLHCGKEFNVIFSKRHKTKYCSQICFDGDKKWGLVNCLTCGKEIRTTKNNKRYCSLKCKSIGDANPNWAGGIKIEQGRTWIWKNGKYYLRSHINWMKANEIYMIPEGFVIHHKDLDKSNDNPNNLALLPDGYHKSMHMHHRERNAIGQVI